MILIPTVIEKTHQWERSYDLYSRLLKDRIVFIWTEVESQMANSIIWQLLYLYKDDPEKDIHIYVNTPWWEVYSWMAIYDTIKYIQSTCKVHITCVWLAASMWSIFMCAWSEWCRYMLPNSRIMIHQPSSWSRWQITDMQIAIDEWLKLKKLLTQIISDRVWKPFDIVLQDMERDKWLSAEEALEYWLIDKITTSI